MEMRDGRILYNQGSRLFSDVGGDKCSRRQHSELFTGTVEKLDIGEGGGNTASEVVLNFL